MLACCSLMCSLTCIQYGFMSLAFHVMCVQRQQFNVEVKCKYESKILNQIYFLLFYIEFMLIKSYKNGGQSFVIQTVESTSSIQNIEFILVKLSVCFYVGYNFKFHCL